MAARPTIFIGLGGAGTRIVDTVARRLQESTRWEDIRARVGFVCADFWEPAEPLAEPVQTVGMTGRDLARQADNYEKLERRADDARLGSWLGPSYSELLSTSRQLQKGAGGSRLLSRLRFYCHLAENSGFREVLRAEYDRLSTAAASRDSTAPYRLLFAASLCGETGGAILLPAAYLVRSLWQRLSGKPPRLEALLLLPSAFREISDHGHLNSNAYAALKEIDAFMAIPHTAGAGGRPSMPLVFDPHGRPGEDKASNAPFESVCLLGGHAATTTQNLRAAAEIALASSIDPLAGRFAAWKSNQLPHIAVPAPGLSPRRYETAGVSAIRVRQRERFVSLCADEVAARTLEMLGSAWTGAEVAPRGSSGRLAERILSMLRDHEGELERVALAAVDRDAIRASVSALSHRAPELRPIVATVRDRLVATQRPIARSTSAFVDEIRRDDFFERLWRDCELHPLDWRESILALLTRMSSWADEASVVMARPTLMNEPWKLTTDLEEKLASSAGGLFFFRTLGLEAAKATAMERLVQLAEEAVPVLIASAKPQVLSALTEECRGCLAKLRTTGKATVIAADTLLRSCKEATSIQRDWRRARDVFIEPVTDEGSCSLEELAHGAVTESPLKDLLWRPELTVDGKRPIHPHDLNPVLDWLVARASPAIDQRILSLDPLEAIAKEPKIGIAGTFGSPDAGSSKEPLGKSVQRAIDLSEPLADLGRSTVASEGGSIDLRLLAVPTVPVESLETLADAQRAGFDVVFGWPFEDRLTFIQNRACLTAWAFREVVGPMAADYRRQIEQAQAGHAIHPLHIDHRWEPKGVFGAPGPGLPEIGPEARERWEREQAPSSAEAAPPGAHDGPPRPDPRDIESDAEVALGECLVKLTTADICSLSVDAIAVSRSRSLRVREAPSRSVHGAIQRRGGAEIDREASCSGPLEHGGVSVTAAGRLPARHVIHAGVIDDLTGRPPDTEILREVVRRCLEEATERGWTSVALPLLAARAGGIHPREAAGVMFDAVMEIAARRDASLVVIFSVTSAPATAELMKRMMPATTAATPAPAAASPPSSAEIPSALLLNAVEHRFPHPVARACYGLREGARSGARLSQLADLLSCTVRHLAVLAFSDAIAVSSATAGPLLERLKKPPSLGDWTGLLRDALKTTAGHGEAFLSELYGERSRHLLKSIDALVEQRNDLLKRREGTPPTPAELKDFKTAVLRLLQSVAFLKDYPLVAVDHASAEHGLRKHSCRLLMGFHGTAEHSVVQSDLELSAQHVYCVSPAKGEVLDLHPFYVHRDCPDCHKAHLFVLRKVSSRRMEYRGIAGSPVIDDDDDKPVSHSFKLEEGRAELATELRRPELRRRKARLLRVDGASARERLEPGVLIDKRYRVLAHLRSGGMADIYEVKDEEAGGDAAALALKLLPYRYLGDHSMVERFLLETSNARDLDHPSITRVLGSGDTLVDLYIVMERATGWPAGGDRVALDASELPLPLDVEQVLDIGGQVCDALSAVHAAEILHRDIKPANLLLFEGGRVKLTDFGIARSRESITLTMTGMAVGTPEYMSPEQFEGKEPTARSDIYSLGVVLFELLTGSAPFRKETALASGMAHARDPVPSPRRERAEVPAELDKLIRKCLAKEPEQRFASAADLARELQSVAAPLDEQAPEQI